MAQPPTVASVHSGDWDLRDSNGRRIGFMWPEDFRSAIETIFGARKGILGFARYAGLSSVCVSQYCRGVRPVPKFIALLVEFMLMNMADAHSVRIDASVRMRNYPKLSAKWLKKETSGIKTWLDRRPVH